MNRHLSSFYRLRCAPDVLAAAFPKSHPRLDKEITESVSLFKRIARTGTVWDLCAGNMLTSILAAHMGMRAVAVDKKRRPGQYSRVKNFQYREMLLEHLSREEPKSGDVVIAVHPCHSLAEQVMDFYVNSKATHLLMTPCCAGDPGDWKKYSGLLDKYTVWCMYLADRLPKGFEVRTVRDKHNMSPKNVVIIAKREKQEESGYQKSNIESELFYRQIKAQRAHKQAMGCKHEWQEVVYPVHPSRTVQHCRKCGTANEARIHSIAIGRV